MSLFYETSDENLREVKVICSSNERHVYEKKSVFFIHPLFTGQNEWPKETKIHCYYDGEPFTGIPIPLPLNYIPEKNRYMCYGIFCSASCAKAYMDTNPVYSNSLSMIWLKKIMCEVFGDYTDITAAPPKELLIKYGGELNIEEFRSAGKQQTSIYIHTLPFFTCALAFELVREYGGKPREKTIEQDTRDAKKLKRNLNKKKFGESITTDIVDTTSTIQDEKNPPPPPSFPPPPPPELSINQQQQQQQQQQNYNNDTQEIYDDDNLKNVLPDNLVVVPADVGNRWGIRGLKRPKDQIEMQLPQQQTNKPLFQEYIEKKLQNKNKPTTSIDSVPVSQSPKPLKRRGRPKAPKKPESPKTTSRGTLTSFLKTR
jgi:hypothetical protein